MSGQAGPAGRPHHCPAGPLAGSAGSKHRPSSTIPLGVRPGRRQSAGSVEASAAAFFLCTRAARSAHCSSLVLLSRPRCLAAAWRHLPLQYLTLSQSFSHFLRQVMMRPHWQQSFAALCVPRSSTTRPPAAAAAAPAFFLPREAASRALPRGMDTGLARRSSSRHALICHPCRSAAIEWLVALGCWLAELLLDLQAGPAVQQLAGWLLLLSVI
jgi:hypothetical protein